MLMRIPLHTDNYQTDQDFKNLGLEYVINFIS